ncbi:MAG: glycosyltransferase family 39 protein [Candidatus Levybacteria bacterium]|nr:glycosyltransferase family 39 protein [Candidatus Levybacteria bacterium]
MSQLVVIFIYFFIAGITFGKLPLTFFQQDEWALFSYFIYWDRGNLSWIDRLFFYEQYTHLIPLSNLLSYVEFKLFGIDFTYYAIVSIFIHLVSTMLVFYLSRSLFKNQALGFLAGLLFLTNSISHQSITWIVTTMGTGGSTFFVLLTLIFFVKYLQKKNKIYLAVSLLFIFVSLQFKETAIFILLVPPIYWLLFKEDRKITFRHILIPIASLGMLYGIYRSLFFIASKLPESIGADLSQPSVMVYVFRLFSLPIKTITQSLIPVPYIIQISDKLIHLGYPQFVRDGIANGYIVESVGADIVSLFLALGIIIVSAFCIDIFKKRGNLLYAKIVVFSLIFISLSSVPLLVIPGSAGYFSLFDGRHLYITSIFTSILLTLFFYMVYLIFKKIKFINWMIGFLILFFIVFHIQKIRGDINQQVGTAIIRKSILSQIISKYPDLPKKTVFYIESDKPYYGLPEREKIVPFQSGFGQTLLVWYDFYGQKYPGCFFKGEYLYEITSEGYRECEGRGFGYFRRKESLLKAIEEYNIPLENIIGLSYNSSAHKISLIELDI